AHHGIASYRTAVQHRSVADMAVHVDDCVVIGDAVHHAGVLYVGAGFHDDAPEIAPQAGKGADIGVRPHDDVSDQHGAGMHVRGGIDDGRQAVDGIDSQHGA